MRIFDSFGPHRHVPTITGWCIKHSCTASLEFPCAECLVEMEDSKERDFWLQHRMLSESIREEREKEIWEKAILKI